MTTLRIGQVSKLAGVTVESVRFYERRGLVPSPRRLRSGYRVFGPDAVRRIRFVRHAQELGFSLDEISELLSLRVHARTSCGSVQEAAQRRLADVETKLARLSSIRSCLLELLSACSRREATEPCPILGALDRPDSRRIDAD